MGVSNLYPHRPLLKYASGARRCSILLWVSEHDRQLISLELDAIFGLAPGEDGTEQVLLDRDKKAVFAWSPAGRVFALNPDIGIDFTESAAGLEEDYVPAELPQTVKEFAEAVRDSDPDSPVAVEGGPSFLIPSALPPAPQLPTGVEIIVSDPAGQDAARLLHRPDNWGPDEWPDLIEGRLGAWAMAVRDAEPVAICFTPASNDSVAEAGVWTRPDHRGHGLASAVVWAWADHERPSGRTLLYSTWADNTASQAVAHKMGLSPLGWIWKVT
jgi:GNAT superfamily N-acetyltransferase